MSIKALINSQDWIPGIKKNTMARTAIQMLHARLPRHVKQEIKIAAAVGGVDHFDAIAANFAYEVALVSLASAAPSIGDLFKSLSGVKATPVGCTTLVSISSDERAETPINDRVEFARNLDWPDRDGSLKKHTIVKKYTAPNKGELRKSYLPLEYESVTFPGYSGILTGFAPQRFAVAINAVMSVEAPQMGASPTFLLRQALDECASFDSAVKLLSETPLVTSAAFTVVSAEMHRGPEDGAVVIERTPFTYALRRAEHLGGDDWLLVATNSMRSISSKWDPVPPVPGLSDSSDTRYDSVFRDVKAALPIQTVLANAEFGCTVYRAAAEVLLDKGLRVW
jgi:hypothetical protein